MAGQGPKTLMRAVHETFQVYGISFIVAVLLLLFVPAWMRWMFFYLVGMVFLTCVIAPFVNDFKPRSRVASKGKAVFISGCDSGFGQNLARRLDDERMLVFAGCLFPEGEGALSLKKAVSERLHIVPLDVTKDDSIGAAAKYVEENIQDYKLWAVVNNAGISDGGESLWTNPDAFQRVMDINTFGVVKFTKSVLPLLCKNKGRVIAVSSAAGRYTYPGLVPYCMSKCATISFCEGLRMEMYRFGVKVVTIEPWMFKTPITDEESCSKIISRTWDRAPAETKELLPEDYLSRYQKRVIKFLNFSISHNPDQVVDCMEEAVLAVNPKYFYNPGTLYSRLSHWVISRLPKPIADLIITREFTVGI